LLTALVRAVGNAASNGGPAMFNEDDVHTLVAHLRPIASDCFDLRAVKHLHLLADQIEKKGQAPKKAVLTKNNSEGQPTLRRFET
jgi:hypothetical protein